MRLNAILLICALIIAGGLMWYSSHNTSGTVPIIRADNSSIKERPTDRGGMNIAHKDSTIYNTMRGDKQQRHVENLLAEHRAQSTVSRDELFAGIKAQKAKQQQESTIKELKADESVNSRIAGNVPVDVASPTGRESEQQQIDKKKSIQTEQRRINTRTPIARPKQNEPIIADTKQPKKSKEFKSLLAEVQGLKIDPIQKNKKPIAPTQPEQSKSTFKAGNKYIQIGSLKSEAAAKLHWAARKKEFPSALSGFKLRIQHIEIAGRGNFYRVQGGPASYETAKQACATLNKRHPKSCIVK